VSWNTSINGYAVPLSFTFTFTAVLIVIGIANYCRDGDSPLTSAEWAALLDQQQRLHDTEMQQWKAVLSNTIQLMDHMVHTLSDLRASIDHVYHFDSPSSTQAADTTDPDSNTLRS